MQSVRSTERVVGKPAMLHCAHSHASSMHDKGPFTHKQRCALLRCASANTKNVLAEEPKNVPGGTDVLGN